MRQFDPHVVRKATRLMSALCARCCAETIAESCTAGIRVPQPI
ncbi:hypothetical protein SAMN05216330_11086 [Bradyrhizobium sp. Ghvi]|nr:hypothetical protein SAMN05216330_11086 [Bradyrhizobium sp. Ghvi]